MLRLFVQISKQKGADENMSEDEVIEEPLLKEEQEVKPMKEDVKSPSSSKRSRGIWPLHLLLTCFYSYSPPVWGSLWAKLYSLLL